MPNAIQNDMIHSMDSDVQHIANGMQALRTIDARVGWMNAQVIVEHVRDIAPDSVAEQATLFILLAGMPDQALDDMLDCNCTPNRQCRPCDMRARAMQGLNIPDL